VSNNQHSARFNGLSNIFVAEHIIDGTRRRYLLACTLDRLDMLTKSGSRIRHSFLDCLSSRETSLNVGEPDAEGAIRLLFDDGHIMHRHRVGAPHHSQDSK